MPLHPSVFIALVCLTISASAQEVIQKRVAIQSTSTTNDSTIFLVNGLKTSGKILKFFRPEEISLNPVHDPKIGHAISIMEIQVLDTSHVVLKYLKYKASLDMGNQNFRHGMIPDQIHPYLISNLQYVETQDHTSDILVVTLSKGDEVARQSVRYRSHSNRIQWYDVDGKMLTAEEMGDLKLELGEFESGGVISGQQATEKYGDSKYAGGVKVIRRIKKD
jgi:hypothetical protein